MAENLKNPVVSVVMAVYNAERFLKEAVQSILSQNFNDFELICINDGSSDRSLEILQSFQDPRLRILDNESNRGIVYSVNRGIDASGGKYIARFDSDDISVPDRFEKQVRFLDENPDMAMCSSFIRQIDIYGNPNGFWPEDIKADTSKKIRRKLPFDNCVAQPASMIRAEILKKYKYRKDLNIAEDWGLWLEMVSDGLQIAKIKEYLINYRIVPNSFTHGKNAQGPHRKSIRFKIQYLRSRISRRKMHGTEWLVLFSLILNCIAYPFKRYLIPLFRKVKLAIRRKPWRFFSVYYRIDRLPDRINSAFFFPYYHTGGAEHVHYAIAEAVRDKKLVLFFTAKSSDDKYRDHFENVGSCVDISDFIDFPILSKMLMKKIAGKLNRSGCYSVFASNCKPFYSLLPYLNAQIRKIDLIHAFVHELEDGPEKWSLPVIGLLDKRVFVSNHALDQMKSWYRKHAISEQYFHRLEFIRNSVPVPSTLPKKSEQPLDILYIGRAGTEKRIPIMLKVIKELSAEEGLRFTLVGDVMDLVPDSLKSHVRLPGMLHGPMMEKHLREAHILMLTSSREGMPMVIMEAMAHGVVPVSTAVGDVPEYVKEGETGYLLPVNPESEIVYGLKERILHLNNNREELMRVAENAYTLAFELFSESTFTEAYRKLLIQQER